MCTICLTRFPFQLGRDPVVRLAQVGPHLLYMDGKKTPPIRNPTTIALWSTLANHQVQHASYAILFCNENVVRGATAISGGEKPEQDLYIRNSIGRLNIDKGH